MNDNEDQDYDDADDDEYTMIVMMTVRMVNEAKTEIGANNGSTCEGNESCMKLPTPLGWIHVYSFVGCSGYKRNAEYIYMHI